MTATFTPLQVILRGLGNGLSTITYIMILLLLVFYLFAIASIMLFRDNDPVHFASLRLALEQEPVVDMLHVSGHGNVDGSVILLPNAAGARHQVTADNMLDWLDCVREPKCIFLDFCNSLTMTNSLRGAMASDMVTWIAWATEAMDFPASLFSEGLYEAIGMSTSLEHADLCAAYGRGRRKMTGGGYAVLEVSEQTADPPKPFGGVPKLLRGGESDSCE
jgi:hypothetical protein